jgi:hypothetical protein
MVVDVDVMRCSLCRRKFRVEERRWHGNGDGNGDDDDDDREGGREGEKQGIP